MGRLNVKPERVHVVYNAVDLRESDAYLGRRQPDGFPRLDAALPMGAPNILTMARLNPVKGIDKMIRAMPRIAAAVPGAKYAIAGDGEDADRLSRLVADSPAKDSITMLGQVTGDEKLECYARSSVFAMPSGDEGFPLVFPEANAFSKPVISTTVGGIPEVVVNGETGLLVEPDDEEGLSNAVIRLLNDPNESRRMGKNARRRVETRFDWKTSAARFRSIAHASL